MSNISVKGKTIDNNTRCIHYHSPTDVIAIKFKCCNTYFPCYYCHKETADHDTEVWKKAEWDTKAVLCGICKNEMTISQYMASGNHCPFCDADLNPNCSKHYHFYFETPAKHP